MKAKTIYYERTVQARQYEPVKIGIELELSHNETASEALAGARAFLDKAIYEELRRLQNVR